MGRAACRSASANRRESWITCSDQPKRQHRDAWPRVGARLDAGRLAGGGEGHRGTRFNVCNEGKTEAVDGSNDCLLTTVVADRLAAFKVPVRIAFWHETLPRNANGKILKPEVKKILAGVMEAQA